MSSILKRSAAVLKLQNEYQMDKLKASIAYDNEVEAEVERWHEVYMQLADCDFLPEMKRHNKRVIDINKRREKHLKALKDRLLVSLRVVKLQQQGGMI